MKRKIITILLLIVLGVPVFAYAAVTGISFGGRVTAVQPCNTGLLAYVVSPKGVLPVMWLWGNLPFSSYLPPHPGQQLIGKIAPTPAPCILGVIPYGVGFPIMFHGSSI